MSRNIKKISNLPLLRTLWNNNLLIVGDLIKPLNKLSKRKGYRWFWLVVLLLLMLGSQLFGAEQAVRVVKYDQAANYQVNIKLGSTSTIVIPRGIKTFVLGN